ncbi:MAG: response regulator [Promethearchaeota archaeon]
MKEEKQKKHIGFTISEETGEKWKKFADENNISTLSKLIRNAVNYFIDSQDQIQFFNNLSNFSRDLKSPLTLIKGFSQLILENNKDQLDFDVLIKIKQIYDQSLILENIINDSISGTPIENFKFDILIVDDDEATLKLLMEYFKSQGYNVKVISKGLDAAKILHNCIPKLILVDILLPDIDGYKICTMIKNDKMLQKIPVYYITALDRLEVEKKMKETKANGYFLKPFNLKEFNKLFDLL